MTVKSAARALDVLELLALHPSGLTLAQIYEQHPWPKSSTYALLDTLIERGYVRALEPGRFALGVRAFEIGQTYLHTVDLVHDGGAMVRRVSLRCDETVHLAALDNTDVLYLAKWEGTQQVRMVSAVGKRVPAHATGVGKILLAGLSADELDARLAHGALPSLTPQTISDPGQLRDELARIRRQGHALDHEESTPGLSCVAVPIYDPSHLVGAASVAVPTVRFDDRRSAEFLELLRASAEELSLTLGAATYPATISEGTTRCL